MALFQKKPQTSSSAPLYTLGLEKTVLVVGLGNPGKDYEGTRHNIGFACVDYFAQKHEFAAWIAKKDLKSHITSHNIGGTRVILAKPTTFMNLSGEAVAAVMHFYKIPLMQLLVIHDELDISFGQIRTREGGASAGHNGIKSLIEQVGEEFSRIRVGIGPKLPERLDSADFVLSAFDKEQQAYVTDLYKEVASIIGEFTANPKLPADTRNFIV